MADGMIKPSATSKAPGGPPFHHPGAGGPAGGMRPDKVSAVGTWPPRSRGRGHPRPKPTCIVAWNIGSLSALLSRDWTALMDIDHSIVVAEFQKRYNDA